MLYDGEEDDDKGLFINRSRADVEKAFHEMEKNRLPRSTSTSSMILRSSGDKNRKIDFRSVPYAQAIKLLPSAKPILEADLVEDAKLESDHAQKAINRFGTDDELENKLGFTKDGWEKFIQEQQRVGAATAQFLGREAAKPLYKPRGESAKKTHVAKERQDQEAAADRLLQDHDLAISEIFEHPLLDLGLAPIEPGATAHDCLNLAINCYAGVPYFKSAYQFLVASHASSRTSGTNRGSLDRFIADYFVQMGAVTP